MKNQTTLACLFALLIAFTLTSCSTENISGDINPNLDLPAYTGGLINEQITISVGGVRSVNAYLSKPPGDTMDMVLVLHGGSKNYEKSIEATKGQYWKPDGGKQFLDNGYAILALEYTEFDGSDDTSGVTKGIMEMEEVISAVDFVQAGSFEPNGLVVEKFYAFGHSRGGANALLAGIDRSLDGVISAEGPLNWLQINDSIESGGLVPTDLERVHYDSTTAEWGDPDVDPTLWIKYSPAEQISDFQSPFLVIQGEEDRAAFIELAEVMRANYDACGNCTAEEAFILHPGGHTDWAFPAILDSIQGFLQAH